jgi:hypothetical protein
MRKKYTVGGWRSFASRRLVAFHVSSALSVVGSAFG